jgi:hypothetical protein
LIFLLSPVVYFFTHAVPVACPTNDFFRFFLPFFALNCLTDVTGSWGVSQRRGKQYYISLFWVNLISIIKVASGKKIQFNVTPKSKQKANPLKYAWPHLTIILLTLIGIVINTTMILAGAMEVSLGFAINTIWGLINCHSLNVYVRAAYWNIETSDEKVEEALNEGSSLMKDEEATDAILHEPEILQT